MMAQPGISGRSKGSSSSASQMICRHTRSFSAMMMALMLLTVVSSWFSRLTTTASHKRIVSCLHCIWQHRRALCDTVQYAP